MNDLQPLAAYDVHRLMAIRQLAKLDFYFFTRFMFSARKGFKWRHNWHHRAICDALMDVFNGKTKRLIINLPPRYGKTEIAVINFIAWCLGKNPDCEFIHTSYSATLAAKNSWEARELITHEAFGTCFPDFAGLRDDASARNDWRTNAGGQVYAVGSGGTITGFGAGKDRPGFGGCILIDDPIKADEASSDLIRQGVIDWFQNTLESRKNTRDTPIILIMQRLHETDLSGWLLKGGNGEQWDHLLLPAITIEDEALWPEKHTLEQLRVMEQAMPYVFAGQYLQQPAPPGGGTIKPDQLNIIDALPDDIDWRRGWDLAATEESVTSSDPDWTAGAKIGRRRSNGRWVIGDMVRMRGRPEEVEAALVNTAKRDTKHTKICLPQDPGQAGKPIWEEEKVLMAGGLLRPLKEIVVGDEVIAADGLPHKVLATYTQGDLDTLMLRMESGRQICAAPDHPFLTTEGWKEAGALTSSDVLALLPNAKTQGKTTRSAEEHRLAGYFVGDGAVGRAAKATETGSCHAEFTCADPVQLADFKACVISLGGEVVQRKRPMQFGTKALQPWLRDTELAGKTAYDKRVPSWVFESSLGGVAGFIGAYFACDGTVSKHGDEVIFYSVSKKLLEDVQHLLLRFGIASTIKAKNGKYLGTRHRSWMLRLRQQDDAYRRFALRIPVFHSMKRQRLQTLFAASRFRRFDEPYLPDRVVEVTPAGKRPCRCLSVEGNPTFTVSDLVVHNSQVAYLTKALSGFHVASSPESGDKVLRANALAAQINVGNVDMLRAPWNDALVSEMRNFPNAGHDDQIDACARAFNDFTDNAANALDYLRMLVEDQKKRAD